MTLPLGNGCSACAIRGGASVDTSMGLLGISGLTADMHELLARLAEHGETRY